MTTVNLAHFSTTVTKLQDSSHELVFGDTDVFEDRLVGLRAAYDLRLLVDHAQCIFRPSSDLG